MVYFMQLIINTLGKGMLEITLKKSFPPGEMRCSKFLRGISSIVSLFHISPMLKFSLVVGFISQCPLAMRKVIKKLEVFVRYSELKMSEIIKSSTSINRRDHLANERTFLAWIRTNLGIMAFGFVVEKFSFFIQEIASFLGRTGETVEPSALQGYSSVFGITLVGVGALLSIMAFLRYKRTERQIDADNYRPAHGLVTLLAFCVFFVGVLLIIYLVLSNAKVH
jgi:putative membrane protein